MLVVAFAWALFWVERVPFFTDDYTRWLAAAEESSWGAVLAAVMDPWGGSDRTWGFAYRPVITLWFKVLSSLHGRSAGAFFVYKSLVLAALFALSAGLARRHLGGLVAALVTGALLLSSHGIVGSMLWHGDMSVLANLFMLAVVGLSAAALASDKGGLVPLILPAVLMLLAQQTKGNAKLLPAILVAGGLACGLPAIKRIAPLAALGVLTALPVRAVLAGFPSPFDPSSGITEPTYTWRAASLSQIYVFLLGDAATAPREPFHLSRSLTGALFPLGWLIGGAFTAALARRLRAREGSVPAERNVGFYLRRLLLAWGILAILATASYPDINPAYQTRYGIDLLVPWSLLLGDAASSVLASVSEGRARRAGMAVLAASAAAHVVFGAGRCVEIRRLNGAVEIIAEKINKRLAADPRAKARAYMDYIAYEHRPALPGEEIVGATPEALAGLQPGSYAIAWQPPLLADFDLVLVATGKTPSLFDKLVPPREDLAASLLYKVAPAPGTAEAEAALAEGRYADAEQRAREALELRDTPYDRNLLAYACLMQDKPAEAEAALAPVARKRPMGMQNARFNYGLALLKLGRPAEASAEYKRLALEYPNDPLVLYNYGVSLRAAGLATEAARAFASVLRVAPGNEGAKANLGELKAAGISAE